METINTIFGGVPEKQIEQYITVKNNPTETAKNINERLMAVFGMKKNIPEKLNKIKEIESLEINETDLKLAKIFGKETEIKKLQPISLASVMQDLEKYKMAA